MVCLFWNLQLQFLQTKQWWKKENITEHQSQWTTISKNGMELVSLKLLKADHLKHKYTLNFVFLHDFFYQFVHVLWNDVEEIHRYVYDSIDYSFEITTTVSFPLIQIYYYSITNQQNYTKSSDEHEKKTQQKHKSEQFPFAWESNSLHPPEKKTPVSVKISWNIGVVNFGCVTSTVFTLERRT